ncbi:tetratricopeptide repeat protein [Desulfocurvus sp. DL9XJH121]
MAVKNAVKSRLYEKTIVDYAAKDNGFFIALSHDQHFLKMLRQVLNKDLFVGTDRIRTAQEENGLLKELKAFDQRTKGQGRPLVLIERVLHNRSTLPFIKNLKTLYPDLHVVVLTAEVERQVLILLHEIGVSNFITKPVSVNTLIEKLAFTIKPQGKIGQYLDRAKDHLAKGLWDEAEALAAKVLELKPGSPAALMVRGDAEKGKGEVQAAEAAYLEAHKGASLYLEPLKKLASLYEDEGDLEKQLSYLKKLDRLSPLNVERKINMGEIHMEFGDVEAAEQCFEQAVANARKEAQLMMEEIRRSIAEKCMDKAPAMAEKFFRSIIESKAGALREADIETFNRLGIALRRQGRWQDAVSEYDQALGICPDDENLHFNRAVALSEGGRHREAHSALQRVLDLVPDFGQESAVLSFNIGIMFANVRKSEDAGRYFRHTLDLDPGHQGARKMLQGL